MSRARGLHKRLLFLFSFLGLVGGVWLFLGPGGAEPPPAPVSGQFPLPLEVRESLALHPPFPVAEVGQAAFPGEKAAPPTAGEVTAARGINRTVAGKRRYLELLEAFGFRGHEALPLLRMALNDPDQEIRRAALRGLGRTETAEAENLLAFYAKDGVAVEESTEAALVLGQMVNPSVTGRLRGLLGQSRDPVLREHLVDALAGRPWEQTQAFFSNHLRDPKIAPQEKQNALAMLGLRDSAPPETLSAALNDVHEELRAGAYQGLVWRSQSFESQKIKTSLLRETDPTVRGLAYEAWGNQEDARSGEILAQYRKETDTEARLRALKAWARSYGRDPVPGDPFLREAVAVLEQVAMTDRDPGERREALQALQATSTLEGREALGRIAASNSLLRIRELARSMSLKD